MKSALDLPINDLAILLVGDPGSRKTTLALQFPGVYIFDCDKNMSAPLNYLKQIDSSLPSKIHYDHAYTDDEGKPIPPAQRYAHFTKCITLATKDPSIQTIIVDSLTAFVDVLVSEVKRQASRADNLEMRIQDWGTFGGLLKHVVTQLRTSGKIVVFTGHNRVEKDESDGRWKYFLNIPGQSSTLLSGLFTDVWNPYPHITGIGSTQKHEWKVRCLPSSETDHRGIKSSLGFKVVEDYNTVVERVKALHTKPA